MEPTSHTMSLSGITRSYLLFLLLLLLGNLLYGYNYVNAYIGAKQNMLASVARQIQQRVETYRFITYQIYENIPAESTTDAVQTPRELRLRPDIYLLDKVRHKTDALIFGQHDNATPALAQSLSRYLDVLWSASTDAYSLYYLNGQDNSLILISTMPMKDLSARYKDGYLGNLVETRKAEMLQQSNALDLREGFSGLRKFRFLNAYYFTLRTTFNNPGHLATVIAFDLPVGDMLPDNLPATRFQLQEDQDSTSEWGGHDELPRAFTQLGWPWVTVNAPIYNTPLKIQFHIPTMTLTLDLARNNFWVLLINLALLILSAIGFYIIRHQYVRPGKRMAAQLNAQQEMNQEIITHLPMGLLIYRFDSDTLVASNKLADHLLPHLSLNKIAAMADRHQGKVQVSVNNAMYEVQMVRSQQTPYSALFLIRNLDSEMLMSQKLKLTQAEYEKNLTARKTMTDNLGRELRDPLARIMQICESLRRDRDAGGQSPLDDLWLESQHAQRLIDEITLLTAVESQDWAPPQETFRLHERIDAPLLRSLPAMRRKGLMLLGRVETDPAQQFNGDIATLERVLEMLLHYAIITTAYGKIGLTIAPDAQRPGLLQITLSDTGAGISSAERHNLRYPALAPAQRDRFARGSSLTYYLCAQLCRRLGGELTIDSRHDIGTHYRFSCQMQALPLADQDDEKLLDGITIRLRITSEEIRSRVAQRLEGFGATLLTADAENDGAENHSDLTLTDDPAQAQTDTLLLAADIDGFEEYAPQRIRANFNLTDALIDAILLLIERQMAVTEPPAQCEYAENTPLKIDNNPFKSKDYYSLFLDTVPADVQKLYTESDQQDWPSLALTAHRLKGVFAMLAFPAGKGLCEQLEEAIKRNDAEHVNVLISHIDAFVSQLLQLGNQQYE
ncbi:phosphotransferase RcsD [Edwardsiella ictaluri]|uniref:phosphotransferase RcsD n=1 Tax=Edwardsiella ictaluri TaxID=67780 RepID=UPI003784E785